ncbi:DNA ligase 1 isoform X2 [Halyomorpha halys]|uniref:DNA ligase 1 isoform X2 n=1 Tax=Halyomorpha halys TaxID=286706 RepID=UPI0034D15B73
MNNTTVVGKRPRGRPRTKDLHLAKWKTTTQDKPKWKSGIVKLAPNPKDVVPVEVISLDGDDEEANEIIGEEDIEELLDNKNNSENDNSMEVISLVDEESSSDEDKDTPIGTAKVSFLDDENRKIHRYVKILNAEDENELIDVEDVSSDSDIEEVIESEKRIYITIDPDDYKKVMKEKSTPEDQKKVTKASPEDFKKIKNKNKTIIEGKKKLKKNRFIIDSQMKSSLEDSLKGPNIPKAICCHSCSFVCFKEEELTFHIAVKHPSKAEVLRTYTAAEIQELEREMRDQADDCSSCSQALWYLPTLRAHAMIHLTGQVGCEACHHGTSVIKLLMDHLESHVGSEEEEDSD